jgi:mannose-1-phosphate guanylyltransferase / mannose-6-phosphate isomerase
MLIQPLVLCGGSGSRLWPLSREKYPKQLLQLVGSDSMFQATLQRISGLNEPTLAPLVVCSEEYRFVIAEQLRCIGQSGTLVLEPVGRNTAPALTLGALEATRSGADPVLLVMPADHVIVDDAAFRDRVCSGAVLAQQGAVVTFGITPTGPETGYGYIQCGAHSGDSAARAIQRFVEKPQLDVAQRYLQEGNYLWNGGLFMLRASVWLDAMRVCRPDILQACESAWNAGKVMAYLCGSTPKNLQNVRQTRLTTL